MNDSKEIAARLVHALSMVFGGPQETIASESGGPCTRYSLPRILRLEACSICQLKCPSCSRSTPSFKATIGAGFLKAKDFRGLLDQNPGIAGVELSNNGEIFLNPELLEIMAAAYERQVFLAASNGVNLNTAADQVLEGLVRYKIRHLTCSIDGASPDTYKIYRVNGSYEAVMDNLAKINYFKKKYGSPYPILSWQFVVFGHNEHELPLAWKKAAALGMRFSPKLSCDEDFSPIRDPELIKRENGFRMVSRREYRRVYGLDYIQEICYNLWGQPQINWDGKVLGCCCNFWGDFGGNAFEEGLLAALQHEKLAYAKAMLRGQAKPREDIPCATCKNYLTMQASGFFFKPWPAPLRRGLQLLKLIYPACDLPRLRYWLGV